MNIKNRIRSAALVLGAGLVPLASSGAFAQADAEFAGALNAVKTAAVKDAVSLGTAREARAQAEVQAAPAQAGAVESIVRDETTTVPVDLNGATVKCSAADYSMPMLKVLVPGLADLTILNHRNRREGAPCVAAGQCSETLGPDVILKTGAGTEEIPVRVVLKKEAVVNGDACHVSLVETVSTVIRGVPFFHERRQAVADRTAADCR